MEEETPTEANLRMRIEQLNLAAASSRADCAAANAQRADSSLRIEALRLAIGQGGSEVIVRQTAEAYLAFLKGEPAPEKEAE